MSRVHPTLRSIYRNADHGALERISGGEGSCRSQDGESGGQEDDLGPLAFTESKIRPNQGEAATFKYSACRALGACSTGDSERRQTVVTDNRDCVKTAS